MQSPIETSAGGIVYKKEKGSFLWLIIQHAGKGHWGFPKGHVADKIKDEHMEEAAIREVKEEGGINAQIINKSPVRNEYFYNLNGINQKKHVYYYLMEYISGDITNHDHEVTHTKWATEEEVMNMVTYKTEKEIFKTLSSMISH